MGVGLGPDVRVMVGVFEGIGVLVAVAVRPGTVCEGVGVSAGVLDGVAESKRLAPKSKVRTSPWFKKGKQTESTFVETKPEGLTRSKQ